MNRPRSLKTITPMVRRLFVMAVLSVAGSACLKVEVSALQDVGSMLPLLEGNACGKTFFAFLWSATESVNGYYTFSACSGLTSHTYSGANGLVSVVATDSGFAALDGSSTTTVWTSPDGLSWTANTVTAFSGPANAKLAACGNRVVLAYPPAATGSIVTRYSSDGGRTFSAAATALVGASTLNDLQCVDGIFRLSGSASPYYKYSADGTTWQALTAAPSGAPLGLGVHGSTVLGFYSSASYTLVRYDGTSWSSGGGFTYAYNGAIAYDGSQFWASAVDNTAHQCRFQHSADDGVTWNSAYVNCPYYSTYPVALFDIESTGPVLASGGYYFANNSYYQQPLLVISMDGGSTWNYSTPAVPLSTTYGAIIRNIVVK